MYLNICFYLYIFYLGKYLYRYAYHFCAGTAEAKATVGLCRKRLWRCAYVPWCSILFLQPASLKYLKWMKKDTGVSGTDIFFLHPGDR